MNCNEFKEKIVELFDKNINRQTQSQLNKHMSKCHKCKTYYDQLRITFNMLKSQEPTNINNTKVTHRLLHYAAVAAIFLLGFIIGWSHLFSTPAVAEDTRLNFLQQGIQSVRNVGSIQMEVFARTSPQENFAFFEPELPFMKIDVQVLRQNGFLFYRIEKANGRTIVSDGYEQYMWIPNSHYVKGSRRANFLEHFANLIFPERLLTLQKSAITLSNKNKGTLTKTDTTIVLTVEGTENCIDLQQLYETGKMYDSHIIIENTFS